MIRGLRSRYRERRTELRRLERAGRVDVGHATYGDPRIYHYAGDETRLTIGSYVSIARDVTFVLGGNHRIDTVTTFPLRRRLRLPGAESDGQPWSKGDIVVGADVWIGVGALIVSGVCIGDGAVVAAGSIVVSDVAPYSVVAGCPAREVKKRFTDRQRDQLLAIAWWDWPPEIVAERSAEITSDDVGAFIRKYSRVYGSEESR